MRSILLYFLASKPGSGRADDSNIQPNKKDVKRSVLADMVAGSNPRITEDNFDAEKCGDDKQREAETFLYTPTHEVDLVRP